MAEERTKLVGKFGFIGNAADIHGCFIGPEGRLCWCDGRHGHEVQRRGRPTLISQGRSGPHLFLPARRQRLSHALRRRHGQPGRNRLHADGDVLGTVNLFYQTRGDCLVHWLHGGVYPRDDQPQCLAEFRRTGDLLPARCSTTAHVRGIGHDCAIAAIRLGRRVSRQLVRLRSSTRIKSNVTRVDAEGSTLRGGTQRLSRRRSSIDFHPTDVLEDADGSLLVIDTGGWFRIGCPTSQIAKPEIAGAIYRIRRTDAPRMDDPRGLRIDFTKAGEQELLNAPERRPRGGTRSRAARADSTWRSVRFRDCWQPPFARIRMRACWPPGRFIRLARVRLLVDRCIGSARQASSNAERRLACRLEGGRFADAASLTSADATIRRTAAEALGRCGAP